MTFWYPGTEVTWASMTYKMVTVPVGPGTDTVQAWPMIVPAGKQIKLYIRVHVPLPSASNARNDYCNGFIFGIVHDFADDTIVDLHANSGS